MATFVEGEGDQYSVEYILDMKRVFNKFYFRVKWKGYDDPEDNTWEPMESFQVFMNFEFKDKIEALKRRYWDTAQAEKEALQRRLQRHQQKRQQQRQQQRQPNHQNKQERKQPSSTNKQGATVFPDSMPSRGPCGGASSAPPPQAPPGKGDRAEALNYGSTEGSSKKRMASLVSSEASSSSSYSPCSLSSLDSSYCESEASRERLRRKQQHKQQQQTDKDRQRDIQRERQRERRLQNKRRRGFPAPDTAAVESYISREVEQLDLLRLQERQKQTGGKVSCLSFPPQPSLSTDRQSRRPKFYRKKQKQQRQQQQQQQEQQPEGGRQRHTGRCRLRSPTSGFLRGGEKDPLILERSSNSSRSSSGSSMRSKNSSSSSSSRKRASEQGRKNGSPMLCWLEGEQEAPDLLPAILGNKENAFLEFRGDWDPVAQANLRCRELRQQLLQQQQKGFPLLQQQQQQQQPDGSATLQQNKRAQVDTQLAVEVVGLGCEETEADIRHVCKPGCYCRAGHI